jgi:hypothetical protein
MILAASSSDTPQHWEHGTEGVHGRVETVRLVGPLRIKVDGGTRERTSSASSGCCPCPVYLWEGVLIGIGYLLAYRRRTHSPKQPFTAWSQESIPLIPGAQKARRCPDRASRCCSKALKEGPRYQTPGESNAAAASFSNPSPNHRGRHLWHSLLDLGGRIDSPRRAKR